MELISKRAWDYILIGIRQKSTVNYVYFYLRSSQISFAWFLMQIHFGKYNATEMASDGEWREGETGEGG